MKLSPHYAGASNKPGGPVTLADPPRLVGGRNLLEKETMSFIVQHQDSDRPFFLCYTQEGKQWTIDPEKATGFATQETATIASSFFKQVGREVHVGYHLIKDQKDEIRQFKERTRQTSRVPIARGRAA